MVHHDVTFIPNPDDRCVVASIGMIINYFMPERPLTMTELEEICGYQPGKGTWEFQYMLWLDDHGFEMRRIDDLDLEQFADDPEKYLRQILHDPEALAAQLADRHALQQHATQARDYLRRGLHHEKRPATRADIEHFLHDGWLVRLEVNAATLAGKSGYDAHSIIVVGYDKNGAIIHNPDGRRGNQSNHHVAWETLMRAWREYSGSFSLYAFRRPLSSTTEV